MHGYPEWHCLHGNPEPKLITAGNSVKKAAKITVKFTYNAYISCSDTASKDVFSETQCEQLTCMIQE